MIAAGERNDVRHFESGSARGLARCVQDEDDRRNGIAAPLHRLFGRIEARDRRVGLPEFRAGDTRTPGQGVERRLPVRWNGGEIGADCDRPLAARARRCGRRFGRLRGCCSQCSAGSAGTTGRGRRAGRDRHRRTRRQGRPSGRRRRGPASRRWLNSAAPRGNRAGRHARHGARCRTRRASPRGFPASCRARSRARLAVQCLSRRRPRSVIRCKAGAASSGININFRKPSIFLANHGRFA